MIRLAADEDFNGAIVRGVLRRNAAINIVRVQDAGLSGFDDAAMLAWAAAENRVLLTHDVATVTAHAYARIDAGLPMPGLLEVCQRVPLGIGIADVLLIAECSRDGEWSGPVPALVAAVSTARLSTARLRQAGCHRHRSAPGHPRTAPPGPPADAVFDWRQNP